MTEVKPLTARGAQEYEALAALVVDIETALGCESTGGVAAARVEILKAIAALKSLSPVKVVTAEQINDFADEACSWLCELPDRTSPEDWPEACLVTGEELHGYLVERLTELLTTPASQERPAQDGGEG